MKLKSNDWIICCDNIRRLRRERSLTQRELSRKLKVSTGTIGNIESNYTCSVRLLCSIANFFNIPVGDLFIKEIKEK
jgi:DNA-binding XRE family transcriptional regulator